MPVQGIHNNSLLFGTWTVFILSYSSPYIPWIDSLMCPRNSTFNMEQLINVHLNLVSLLAHDIRSLARYILRVSFKLDYNARIPYDQRR